MREIIIQKNESGQRLDKFLQKYMREASRSFFYKMLRKKNIKLNGARAQGNEILAKGDRVTLYLSEETIQKFCGQAGCVEYPVADLDIVYEDEDIVLVNKPAGMLSQKAKPQDVSLVEYLLGYLQKEGVWTKEGAFTPGVCNRLDRNTSGLVIGGKSLAGLQIMSEQLRQRKPDKFYTTIVEGQIETPVTVCGYLSKDEQTNKVRIHKSDGKGRSYIETGYEPLRSNGSFTLLRVKLITGKTHQIRSHLSSIGHPVYNDIKYGAARQRGQNFFLLHAGELRFYDVPAPLEHLSDRQFFAPLPDYFERKIREIFVEDPE